jgi:hypothetical protein
MFPACRFWSKFDYYRRLPAVNPSRAKWRLIRAGPVSLAWPPGTQRRCGQVMMMRLMARLVHGGPAAAVVLAVVLAVGVAGPAAGSVSGSDMARTGPGQATAVAAGAPVISAAQRAAVRTPVRDFPDRSLLPADAVLAGISCVRASFCLAVGGYADGLGREHSLAEEWDGRRWLVVPGARGTGLSGVSCTSARFCMALGSPAQRWDGRRWTVARTPRTPRSLHLVGISCTRRSFCMAVGSGESQGFECEGAAAWNGTRWRAFPILNPCGEETRGFTRVSCVSRSMCLAVGAVLVGDNKTDATMSEKWDGRTWQALDTPAPGVESDLSDVSCLTATFCLAVGAATFMISPPCSSGSCTVALTWNGSTWQQAGTPADGSLSAVSCVSAASCIAVSRSQAMAWDGTDWTQLTLAQPATAGMSLPAIACRSGTGCMAVGGYRTPDGAVLPLAEQWNGSIWRVRRTPGPGDAFNGLSGVSCASVTRCMAVGNRINGSDVQVTLAERWDGRRWLVLPTPNPGPRLNVLTGVSCPAAANCMAVGYYFDAAGSRQALAEQWNGVSWTTLAIPHDGVLTAVSCPAVSSCMAVGSYLSLSTARTHTLTAAWDGTAWTVQPSPDVRGGLFSEFTGVSCTGGSNCIAVGDGDPHFGRSHQLTALWNGSAWQVQAPVAGGGGRLTSVSCPRRASCVAVGTSFPAFGHKFPARTVAESWNGSRWQVRATPAISRQLSPLLAAVSCSRPARCIAAGGYFSPSGKAFALAERWNGHRWRRLASIRSPDPAFNDLYGISCPAAARCIAAGERGIQLTSAYRWDGARWRLLRSRNP